MSEPAYERGEYPWFRVRSPLYDAIYVSPHMDDAVYSCGGQMALQRRRGARVLVITVFGNGRTDERGRGVFGDIAQRKREERAALDLLDVDHVWLNFPDLLCRKSGAGELLRYALPYTELARSPLLERMYAALFVLLQRLLGSAGRAHFPLAIGAHPDHRLVYACGRSLVSRWSGQLSFYEDVPYTEFSAVRDERLRYLGFPVRGRLLHDARDMQRLVAAQLPALQQPLAYLALFGQLLLSRSLFAALSEPDALGRALALEEIVIDDVIARKVEAMRAYETQTAYFYPAGDALYQRLVQSAGRYVERLWHVSDASGVKELPLDPAQVEREQQKLSRLLASLSPHAVEA